MSDTNRIQVSRGREVSFNVSLPAVPATDIAGTQTLFAMRPTAEKLNADKKTVESAELRSDRMIPELLRVGLAVSGSTEHEFSYGDYDDLVEMVMQSAWAVAVTVTGTFSANTFTADAGTPFGPLLGVKHVQMALCATNSNNGIKRVVAVTTSAITFAAGQVSGTDSADALTIAVAMVTAIDAVTVTIAGQVMTASAGTFSTATQGARYVKLASMATSGNNGIKKVVSCTSTVLTLAAGSLTGSDAGDVCTVQCRYIRNGTNFMTQAMQKQWLDHTTPDCLFMTGVGVASWEFKMDAQNKVTQTYTYMGANSYSRDNLPAPTIVSPSTNHIINTSTDIGSLTKDGSALTNPAKAVSFKLDNGLRERPYIGSLITAAEGSGFCNLTGQVDVYLADPTFLRAYLNHTPFALEFPVLDADGNVFNVYMPSCQSSTGTPQGSGVNSDEMQSLAFRALPASNGFVIQIDMLPFLP